MTSTVQAKKVPPTKNLSLLLAINQYCIFHIERFFSPITFSLLYFIVVISTQIQLNCWAWLRIRKNLMYIYDVRNKCSHWFWFWTNCRQFLSIFPNLEVFFCGVFRVKTSHYCITLAKSFGIFNKASLILQNQNCGTTLVEKKEALLLFNLPFSMKKAILADLD